MRYAAADRAPAEVLEAANVMNGCLVRVPVSAEGRLELLWYVREQSISTDYHRYGNLGPRADEVRLYALQALGVGGGLLKTLARTVRERQKMRMKVKAASAEGNASAIILTAAPFCVFIFLWVASPHFYGDVINERPIQIGLGLLLGWMGVGNIIMRKMIDMRI